MCFLRQVCQGASPVQINQALDRLRLNHRAIAVQNDQHSAQISQLNEKIQQEDWTGDVNFRDEGQAMCAKCGQETGGGKFCQHCGAPLAAAPAATKKFCTNCGTELADGVKFCAECGTPAPA